MSARLVVVYGGHKGSVLKLRSDETIVGRQSGCDIRIPSAEVSRRHCRLLFDDGVLTVEDLDSANGTFVNGKEVKGSALVRPGDRLEIGPVIFVAKYEMATEVLPEDVELESVPDDDHVQVVEVGDEEDDVPVVEVEDEEEDIPVVDVEFEKSGQHPTKKRTAAPRKSSDNTTKKVPRATHKDDTTEDQPTASLDDSEWEAMHKNKDIRGLLSKMEDSDEK